MSKFEGKPMLVIESPHSIRIGGTTDAEVAAIPVLADTLRLQMLAMSRESLKQATWVISSRSITLALDHIDHTACTDKVFTCFSKGAERLMLRDAENIKAEQVDQKELYVCLVDMLATLTDTQQQGTSH